MRLGTDENKAGIHVFVYGDVEPKPQKFWPRQSRAACEAIARRHRLTWENTFFLKQHPEAIDAGAFHNDVVAISHQDLLIHHEIAYSSSDDELDRLDNRYAELTGGKLTRIAVSNIRSPSKMRFKPISSTARFFHGPNGNAGNRTSDPLPVTGARSI